MAKKVSYVVLGVGAFAFGLAAYAYGFAGDMLAIVWGPIAFVAGYFVSKFF